MKSFTLAICLFFSLSLFSQTVDCSEIGANTAIFNVLECSDDYILFSVTSEGMNSNSAYLTGIPSNTDYSRNLEGPFFDYIPGRGIGDFSIDGVDIFYFNMPSVDCESVAINFTTYTSMEDCSTEVLIDPNPAPIPTLGQWALIVLAFLFTIFGVVQIRRRVAIS